MSHNNGTIGWSQVATQHGFAFVKATEGLHEVDPMFATNWPGMKAAGVLRGPYHFFHCDEDPVQQAEHFVNSVQAAGYEDTDLPFALDLEDREGATAVGGTQMIANVHAWMHTVKAALGRQPVLYIDHSFMFQYNLGAEFGPYTYLWIARYGVDDPGPTPGWDRGWDFWQYQDNGTVSGIGGGVDLDRFGGYGIEGLKELIVKSKLG